MIPVFAAAFTGLLAWRLGLNPGLAAFAWVAAAGVSLAPIDLAEHRLPDRYVLPAYPAVIILLTFAAWDAGSWLALGRAVLAAAAMFGVYLILALVSRGQLGGGDVKLAGVLGLVLGWLGWHTVLVGTCLGFVLGGAAAAVLLVTGKAGRHAEVSFGPWMLLGALLAVLFASVR